MNALVGRDAELRQLLDLLESGARLVTLTGAVGVGKSALARAGVGRALGSGAFESARMADVSGAASAEALLDAVAPHSLRGAGQLLLVLDGADSVLPFLRPRVAAWLNDAPELTLLVTSREALGASEERVLELSPLALSGPALELFLAHARRARPSFEPSAAEAAILAELLRELDGLPLAIELCAARLAVMGPAALLHRLRQSAGKSSLVALERALQGAWQALEPAQQAALVGLSVFGGGATLEAAEAVIEGPSVVDTLMTLRARSLVTAHEREPGELRLCLLSCVRDFVRRQTDPAALASARARHAAHFAALAAGGRDVERERENLEAVLESVLEAGPMTAKRAEPALRALVALSSAGSAPPPARYLALLDPVLERTRDSGADPALLAHSLVVAGLARHGSGDSARALRDLGNAERVARALGAAEVEGAALTGLAQALLDQDELDPARERALGGLDAFRRAGDRRGEAQASLTLGAIEAAALDPRAVPLLERAAALFAALGDRAALARAELTRAEALLDAGEHALALARIDAARQARPGVACELLAARVAHDQGAPQAGARYAEVAAAARAAGAPELEALALGSGALAAAEQGRLGESYALLSTALGSGRLAPRARAVLGALSSWLDARVLPGAPARTPPASRDPVARAFAAGDLEALAALPCFWARAAARVLGHAPEPSLPETALVVGPEGRWFRAPFGEPVSLERRRPLARIVERLAVEREQRPGTSLGWSELLGAAWPGERVLPEAGAHRVRVAISSLRKLGLGAQLSTRGAGYVFDPDCALVRAPS